MSRAARLSTRAILCALPLLLPIPSAAQPLDPKDAWAALDAFVTGAGGRLSSSSGLERAGGAMLAPDTVLSFGSGFEMDLGTVRLEPRGDEVALIPPPVFTLRISAGDPAIRSVYEISHNGEFQLALNPETVALGLDFDELGFRQTEATQLGQPLDEALDGAFTGLSGRLGMTLAAPYGISGAIQAAGLRYDHSASIPSTPVPQDSTSRSEDLRLELDVRGMGVFDHTPGWVSRAFADGFSARFLATSGVSETRVNNAMGQPETGFDSIIDSSRAELVLADGALSLRSSGEGVGFDLRAPGLAGASTMDSAAFGFDMPLIITPDDRRFGASLSLQEMVLAPELLAAIGAQEFAGETASLDIDLHGNGRWLVEITDNPEPDRQPFDFSSFALNTLAARLGAASLTGGGSFTLMPGAFAESMTAGRPPVGEGEFTFELTGGNTILDRLAAAGLIPPDQQFIARMMLNAMGRSVGEDRLRSDIRIARTGEITVNGMPLPF